MPETRLIGPRYKYPISDAELDRRLAAVRAAMAKESIDCILTQNHCPIFDAGIRYFIDQPTGAYSSSLLVPAEGGMVVLIHGPESDQSINPPWARNCEKVFTKPYCQPFSFTDDMAAEVFVREIREKGYRKVGLFGLQFISLSFGEHLKQSLPGVEFVDFSRQFSAIKAVKSAEEWELIAKTTAIHDQLMATVPALLRPGRQEQEIRSDIERMALNLGCDAIGNLAVASAPAGERAMFTPHFNENRIVEPGDTLSVMIEVAGPGGIYGELSRTFCLTRPWDSLLDLYKIARDCQHAVAEAMKPGVTGREIEAVYNRFVTRYGLAENARFIGHSQGYDMMESPALCGGEDMVIQEDMYFAIHPELDRGNDFANACDNFRVTKDGAVLLAKTPQQVFFVET